MRSTVAIGAAMAAVPSVASEAPIARCATSRDDHPTRVVWTNGSDDGVSARAGEMYIEILSMGLSP
ncbi:hypothetical protein SPHINGO391_440025 [Sphingomonas aurantiaca]|uniref:Uncharacterized protein n=1 Tax=Sphingomonas aurantiaca TaxID=185949 RepID=A0A5E7Z233_9SPHN|nr:hypothetical protein SPHINGO391_440025 [Sphingomonas aurantiaca]